MNQNESKSAKKSIHINMNFDLIIDGEMSCVISHSFAAQKNVPKIKYWPQSSTAAKFSVDNFEHMCILHQQRGKLLFSKAIMLASVAN